MLTKLLAKLRLALLSISVPLTKKLGKVHFPYTHKLIKGPDYYRLESVIQSGDVLLSRTRGELTNLFIPGFFTHAAIARGDEYVIEAIGKGVSRTDLVSFVMTKDYVVLLRPRFADDVIKGKAVLWAEEQVGLPYDYEFETSNKAYYCSELVATAYNKAMDGSCPFVSKDVFGEPTIEPQDFVKAKEKFDIILLIPGDLP